MNEIIRFGSLFYNLISPFPAKTHFKVGDFTSFKEVALAYSPTEEEVFVNLNSLLAGADLKTIEKSLLVSCGEKFPLYKKIFNRKLLPSDAQTLAPFQGVLKFIMVPNGNALFVKSNKKDLCVNLSDPLEIKPKKLFKHLKISKGSNVSKGTILAERFLEDNFTRLRAVSPIEGIVEDIDFTKGNVTIRRFDCEKHITVPLPGKIVGISSTGFCASLSIQTTGYFIKPSNLLGKPRQGRIDMIPSNIEERKSFYQQKCVSEIAGIFDEPLTLDSIVEAANHGLKIFICPYYEDELKKAMNKKTTDLTVASVFFKGVNKFPENFISFFKTSKGKTLYLSKLERTEDEFIFIPAKASDLKQRHSGIPQPLQKVIIASGQYSIRTGRVIKVEFHGSSTRSDVPLVSICLDETDEIVSEKLSDLIY
ncbi:hypothetical protein JXA84_04835 [candidate division WOR-3 bacterium]|nr:hypothetical protein [candidate division WOR-3 bacterium]